MGEAGTEWRSENAGRNDDGCADQVDVSDRS